MSSDEYDATPHTALDEVDELGAILDLPPVGAHASDADLAVTSGKLPANYFASVEEFFSQHVAPMYRRSLTGNDLTWCPKWWLHAEALARLEALWRAWEAMRLDPTTGPSDWMRLHLDHHMAVLLAADGPFKGCSADRGHSSRLEPLPHVPAPTGWWEPHGPD